MQSSPKIYIVSACLTGLCTRYDAQSKKSAACLQHLENSLWIPVCPEQLGGLPTPREAADIHGGTGHDVLSGTARVLTKTGEDVSAQFIKGAEQVLEIAQQQHIDGVILKANSPSCGVHKKLGVTAALLLQHGYRVEEF